VTAGLTGAYLVLLAIAAYAPGAGDWIAVAVVLASGAFLSGVGLWALFHPRVMVRVVPAVVKWTFWVAFVAAVVGSAVLPETARRLAGVELSAPITMTVGLIGFVVVSLPLLLVGMSVASLGAWIARRHPDPAPVATAAVRLWWSGAISLFLVDFALAFAVPFGLAVLLACGLLLLITVKSARLPLREQPMEPWYAPVSRNASRLLIWNVGKRRVDARGCTLGALGAALAVLLSVGPGELLGPLRHQALENLLRLRNEPLLSRIGWALPNDAAEERGAWRRRIVLVEMDPISRRRAMTEASETRIITEAARRLARWGALRVVVPVPQLETSWPSDGTSTLDAPPPDESSVARNRRDLPPLRALLQQEPRTVLAVPRLAPRGTAAPVDHMDFGQPFPTMSDDTRERIQDLINVARSEGDAGLDWVGTTRIPAIRLSASTDADALEESPFGLRSLVTQLTRAARGFEAPEPLGSKDVARLAGREVPLTAPGLAMVDFGGPLRSTGLSRVSYASVLKGNTIYNPGVAGAEGSVGSSPAAEYFKDKLVLLEPLTEGSRETPIGRLTSTEVVAEATISLLSEQHTVRLPWFGMVGGVLLLCILVGQSCVGRPPFAAALRAGMAVVVVLILAPVAIVTGAWLDPVMPVAAVLITSALVTQITFGLEQEERRRQRVLLDSVASPKVVEELLDRSERLALGGERRMVCILFADVRSFTPFAESHTAEKVIEVINRYTTAMTEALLAHGGILDRYTGDGLVARFDVLKSPDDVVHAVRAAVAMRDAAEALADQMTRDGEPALRIGLGLHVGEAVVGLVGSPTQFHYTAMGHSVIVAARLQASADGGEVLISDAVFELVGSDFTCEAREPMWFKGISEPLQTYRVLGQSKG